MFFCFDFVYTVEVICFRVLCMDVPQKRLRIGWFTFTCCEDSTVLFTELMNDHYEEWIKLLDIRHARVLQSNNVMDAMDVAFVEGAIMAPEQEEKLKEIRSKATKLVAIGACAVMGLPSGQRNTFSEEVKDSIAFLLERFKQGAKVKKLDEVVIVDEVVGGCPMNEERFMTVLNKQLADFGIIETLTK